jgi:hypothetical protein
LTNLSGETISPVIHSLHGRVTADVPCQRLDLLMSASAVFNRAIADALIEPGGSPEHQVAKPRQLPNTRRALTADELKQINTVPHRRRYRLAGSLRASVVQGAPRYESASIHGTRAIR